MTQKYLPRFEELFLELTGIKTEDAVVGEDGWLFIPPEVNIVAKPEESNFLSILGWRNNVVADSPAGWWIKPWKNVMAGTYIALTLNEEGSKSFTYLQNGKPGQRHVYYVDRIEVGSFSGAPMLLGQFIFEMEACPATALKMSGGGSNRIYYPKDKRVSSYDSLTPSEVEETKARLEKLTQAYPEEIKRRVEDTVGKIPHLVQALAA